MLQIELVLWLVLMEMGLGFLQPCLVSQHHTQNFPRVDQDWRRAGKTLEELA